MSSPLYCQKTVTRQRSDYNSPLLQYANSNRNKGYFDDITIGVGQDKFSANRMVLSCYSKFFEEKFQVNETFHKSVSIEDIDEESVKAVIDFIFSGKITINQDNVIDLLNAGHNLRVVDLEDYCFEYLESVINSENCFNILQVANQYQNESLKSKVYLHMCKNVDAMIQKLKFKELSNQNIVEFLTILNQNQFGNMNFQYEATVTWTKHNEDKRKSNFLELFQLLDINQLSRDFLKNVICQEPLVKENVICLELVNAKLFQIIEEQNLNFNKSSIICLSGSETRSNVKEVYNLSGGSPKLYPDFPVGLVRSCSIKIDNSIVCIGGEMKALWNSTNQVWQLDLMKDELQWKEIPSMNEKRCNFGAAIYQDSIVVAGGRDKLNFLKSVETFNKQTNRWRLIASLKNARFNHAIVESRGCLFVMGGWFRWFGIKVVSSVERLNGLDEEWEDIQSMNYPRHSFTSVTCQNKIFAIGGLSTNSNYSAMNSVEMFDHSKQKWTKVKSMNIERSGHSACVLQDKIFVVGGKNREDKFVKEIECYNVISDEWSIISQTTDQWYMHSTLSL